MQLHQEANVVCLREFVGEADVPNVHVSYELAGFPRALTIRLPFALNKFLEPTEMTSDVFFQRWKFLCTQCPFALYWLFSIYTYFVI